MISLINKIKPIKQFSRMCSIYTNNYENITYTNKNLYVKGKPSCPYIIFDNNGIKKLIKENEFYDLMIEKNRKLNNKNNYE